MRDSAELHRIAVRRMGLALVSAVGAVIVAVIWSNDRLWTAVGVAAGFLTGFNFILAGATRLAADGKLTIKDRPVQQSTQTRVNGDS